MQSTRQRADYDPLSRFTKTDVLQDIATAEQVIAGFATALAKDRRAFCAHVLFKRR